MLNSSSILQELTLTSIAIFTAISMGDEALNLTKNHLKYHLVSLSVISACVGVTGVLNFEPDLCVFLAQEISLKYGIFMNSLRCLLTMTTVISLLMALVRNICRTPKAELLKSVSDLSETSSKNSSGAFECHPQHWDPSSGSCTSGSTNSRACLRKKRVQIDEASGRSTIYSILFVCYVFQYLPVLVNIILLYILSSFFHLCRLGLISLRSFSYFKSNCNFFNVRIYGTRISKVTQLKNGFQRRRGTIWKLAKILFIERLLLLTRKAVF